MHPSRVTKSSISFAGVKAGMSPLLGGRLCCVVPYGMWVQLPVVVWRLSKLLYPCYLLVMLWGVEAWRLWLGVRNQRGLSWWHAPHSSVGVFRQLPMTYCRLSMWPLTSSAHSARTSLICVTKCVRSVCSSSCCLTCGWQIYAEFGDKQYTYITDHLHLFLCCVSASVGL